jgi:hypothetical protein
MLRWFSGDLRIFFLENPPRAGRIADGNEKGH